MKLRIKNLFFSDLGHQIRKVVLDISKCSLLSILAVRIKPISNIQDLKS